MSGIILLVLFAVFTLVGVWMLVDPVPYLLWLKDARPSLRLREDDPNALATVRFIGGGLVAISILAFAAMIFNRYRY